MTLIIDSRESSDLSAGLSEHEYKKQMDTQVVRNFKKRIVLIGIIKVVNNNILTEFFKKKCH